MCSNALFSLGHVTKSVVQINLDSLCQNLKIEKILRSHSEFLKLWYDKWAFLRHLNLADNESRVSKNEVVTIEADITVGDDKIRHCFSARRVLVLAQAHR